MLGATHPDSDDGSMSNRQDAHIKAGVLLAAPGSGKDLTEIAARTLPFSYLDFSTMTAPTLSVVGDRDMGSLSTRGADGWRDAYDLSPSPRRCSRPLAANTLLVASPDTRRARRRTNSPSVSP